jgi:hypothetical protein
MILSGIPALSAHMRAAIQRNISQILQLHEDLLAELHQAIPQAEFTQSAHQEAYPVTKAKHIRFHSADLMPGRFVEHKITRKLRHSLDIGRSPDRRPQGLVTDTKTIGEVAKIFNKHVCLLRFSMVFHAKLLIDETLLRVRGIWRPLDDHVSRSYLDVQRSSWLARIRAWSGSSVQGRFIREQPFYQQPQGSELSRFIDQGANTQPALY